MPTCLHKLISKGFQPPHLPPRHSQKNSGINPLQHSIPTTTSSYLFALTQPASLRKRERHKCTMGLETSATKRNFIPTSCLLSWFASTVQGSPGTADDIGLECQECRCVNASITLGSLTHCPANKAKGQSQEVMEAFSETAIIK